MCKAVCVDVGFSFRNPDDSLLTHQLLSINGAAQANATLGHPDIKATGPTSLEYSGQHSGESMSGPMRIRRIKRPIPAG